MSRFWISTDALQAWHEKWSQFGLAPTFTNQSLSCFEILSDSPQLKEINQFLLDHDIEFLSVHNNSIPKLIVFDMDSTLIQIECIDELARRNGRFEQVASITESAMRGELDFKQSLEARVEMLRGLSEQSLTDLANELPVTEGAVQLLNWCHANQIKTAVVSGGFKTFTQALAALLPIDYMLANRLEILDGKLSGRVLGEIVDGETKKQTLLSLGEKWNIPTDRIWAVGDGANDIPMMQAAGTGIAVCAKPVVRAQADGAVNQPSLQLICHWLESISGLN